MKKFFAVTSAAVLAASLAFSFSSCSDKSGSSSTEGNLAGGELGSDVNVSQEDLPYGATIMQLTPDIDGVPIMTEIDDRFLSTEEGTAVSEYFGSFSKKDESLLESATYPAVLDFRLKTEGNISEQDFIEKQYENIKSYTGVNFEFTYIMVNSVSGSGETDFSSYDNLVRDLDADANITDRKCITVDCMYQDLDNGGNYSLSNRIGNDVTLYIYTINGNPYVLT